MCGILYFHDHNRSGYKGRYSIMTFKMNKGDTLKLALELIKAYQDYRTFHDLDEIEFKNFSMHGYKLEMDTDKK